MHRTVNRTIPLESVETVRFTYTIVYEEIVFFIYFGYTSEVVVALAQAFEFVISHHRSP